MGFRVRIMFSVFVLFTIFISVLILGSMQQISEIVSEDYSYQTKSKLNIINLQIKNHNDKLTKSGLDKLYSDGYKKLKLKELDVQYNHRNSIDQLVILSGDGQNLIKSEDIKAVDIKNLSQNGDTLSYQNSGEEWILVYEYFEPWQWYIGFTVAKVNKMASVRRYIGKLTLLLIFSMLVFLLSLYFLLQLITSPLRKFSEEVTHMRIYENYSPVQFGKNDELGQLSEAFNKLVTKQSNYAKDLKSEVEKQTDTIKEQQVKLLTSANLSALGEMAGAIAHEINNPLAIIQASSELINKEIDRGLKNKDRTAILASKISKTVNRISKIVDGLLVISGDSRRTEAENLRLEPTITDLIDLCNEKLKNRGIKVEVVWLGESLTAEFSGKKVQISQVLLNLLNNAIHALETEDMKLIKITLDTMNQNIIVKISNSGPHIPEELKEKIFKPFFTTKPAGKGTGLGLSISKLITEELGGTLEVDIKSELLTFILTLKRL